MTTPSQVPAHENEFDVPSERILRPAFRGQQFESSSRDPVRLSSARRVLFPEAPSSNESRNTEELLKVRILWSKLHLARLLLAEMEALETGCGRDGGQASSSDRNKHRCSRQLHSWETRALPPKSPISPRSSSNSARDQWEVQSIGSNWGGEHHAEAEGVRSSSGEVGIAKNNGLSQRQEQEYRAEISTKYWNGGQTRKSIDRKTKAGPNQTKLAKNTGLRYASQGRWELEPEHESAHLNQIEIGAWSTASTNNSVLELPWAVKFSKASEGSGLWSNKPIESTSESKVNSK